MMPFCDLRPHLASPFSPRATPNGILLFSFAFPVCRVPFRPSQPERNFIFNTGKAPKGIIFPCIPHLPRPFFSPRSPERNFIFSLYIHSPQPRPEAPALHYNIFGLIGRLSPRGAQGLPTCRIHPTIVPEMRCAAPKRRNFPARKRYGRHTSGRRDGHTR